MWVWTDSVSQTGEGVGGGGGCGVGQDLGRAMVFGKETDKVGPCYSKLGVTELQPQVFCFANKVLLEHS